MCTKKEDVSEDSDYEESTSTTSSTTTTTTTTTNSVSRPTRSNRITSSSIQKGPSKSNHRYGRVTKNKGKQERIGKQNQRTMTCKGGCGTVFELVIAYIKNPVYRDVNFKFFAHSLPINNLRDEHICCSTTLGFDTYHHAISCPSFKNNHWLSTIFDCELCKTNKSIISKLDNRDSLFRKIPLNIKEVYVKEWSDNMLGSLPPSDTTLFLPSAISITTSFSKETLHKYKSRSFYFIIKL
ncbi:hypothetical protein PPL_05800 [Heterostelium album PN500]|uniref:Uncharacterized protein n=1 Tax=Heterostelium pallidum (strain ATCC 26659 / Pp 5 / PN500) TaxID=670386 RepID=D3BB68_HETP5|nr:hypothetical protein PPL_05800 [Heterostelium album PN500]EFA81805.1 hypothetical protein PPL_05800 [Heterostelium album PN500]|eukprot:XP_020433922.1 hypothetical protein PPL_05800 [Heterostelium album PN500]